MLGRPALNISRLRSSSQTFLCLFSELHQINDYAEGNPLEFFGGGSGKG